MLVFCRTTVVRVPSASGVDSKGAAREKVLGEIQSELERGGSVFWVFPLVEESEAFEHMGSAHEVRCHPMLL